MRLSCVILFLGWLVKQWNLAKGPLSKPVIWVNPSHEIFLGEQFSIYCRSLHLNAQIFHFQLLKEGNLRGWNMEANWPDVGIFTIYNARKTNVGMYRCRYCSSDNNVCSPVSDFLYISITEVAYPKPSVSVNPSEMVTLGESISIYCKNEELQRANAILQRYPFSYTYKTVETKKGESEFSITQVKTSDAGIYRCRYCSQSESVFYQSCSDYSDQVYINVTGYWTSKPFIQLTPSEEISPGVNVTIECHGPQNGLTFLLLKSNQVTASKETGQGRNSTIFHLSRVTSGDVGNYTCHYHKRNEFIWSVPSNHVELLLRGESKISISIWASISAGLLLLVLLLLLIVFVFHRKRKKRSTVKRSAQPMSVVTDFPPTEPDTKTEPDEVSYAVLNHNSLKTKRAADTGQVSESCTYATVAKNQREE